MKSLLLIAFLFFPAVDAGAMAGCAPVQECFGDVQITNKTRRETLIVLVDGKEQARVAPGKTETVSAQEGTHGVQVIESLSGDSLGSQSFDFDCDAAKSWTVVDPKESELRVTNKTGSWVEVRVEGKSYGIYPPGKSALPVREGGRNVVITDYEDGEQFYGQSVSFVPNSYAAVSVVDENCANLEVYNRALEDILVIINDKVYYQPYGEVWSYSTNDDPNVYIKGQTSGKVYYNFLYFYGCGTTNYLDVY